MLIAAALISAAAFAQPGPDTDAGRYLLVRTRQPIAGQWVTTVDGQSEWVVGGTQLVEAWVWVPTDQPDPPGTVKRLTTRITIPPVVIPPVVIPSFSH